MSSFIISIDHTGKKTFDVVNGKGRSCVSQFEELLQNLGEIESQELKPEYHRQETQHQTISQH